MLNEDFDIPNSERANFIGDVKKEMINANSFLFRFITTQKNNNDGNELLGNWWIKDNELMKLFQTAPNSEIFKANVRSRFAVKEHWNLSFEYLITIQLIQSVWGWVGKTKFQAASVQDDQLIYRDTNLIYIGQGMQCFIPNLSTSKGGFNSEYARMVSFRDTEGLFW
ncbi:MAG: hypothetical protein JST47_13355 [Bacteroidetes bacterium]|nr:hypothetical protein [Bacteroidota bacterium]MBS1974021.1 hypothetical protein [Bacteroidota bacterium]